MVWYFDTWSVYFINRSDMHRTHCAVVAVTSLHAFDFGKTKNMNPQSFLVGLRTYQHPCAAY